MTIPLDKRLHAAVGCILAAVTGPFGLAISIPAVVLVAVGKEVWDHYHPPHKAEVLDVVATVLGAIPAWILWRFAC